MLRHEVQASAFGRKLPQRSEVSATRGNQLRAVVRRFFTPLRLDAESKGTGIMTNRRTDPRGKRARIKTENRDGKTRKTAKGKPESRNTLPRGDPPKLDDPNAILAFIHDAIAHLIEPLSKIAVRQASLERIAVALERNAGVSSAIASEERLHRLYRRNLRSHPGRKHRRTRSRS